MRKIKILDLSTPAAYMDERFHKRLLDEQIVFVKKYFFLELESKWLLDNNIKLDWFGDYLYHTDKFCVGCIAQVSEEQEVLFAATFGKAMENAFNPQR